MPVQALIRKLTRPQIDKAIADAKVKVSVRDYEGGALLIVVDEAGEAGDPVANAAVQKIADMDAAIMMKERAEREAKGAAKEPKP